MSSQNYYIPHDPSFRTLMTCAHSRQRRLYADLESQKFGRGGDRKLAKLLGLDAHTVAKGRRDIFSGEIDRERIRQEGGGRKRLEKKRRRSSKKSNV